MTAVPREVIEAAIQILGTTGIEENTVKERVRNLVSEDMTARRLIDWIPEAFGLVLVAHISTKIILPTTFSAKARDGQWQQFNLTIEPIFTEALQIAQTIYHNGPREIFVNVSVRSCMTNAVNNALKDGDNLDGGHLNGPSLLGIPAEVYSTPTKPFVQRLFF